jgi:3-(3-hydroxy-phenyl)propionate hydroxylase
MFDVAIVGFGPVGAVAANLLGQAGIDAVVIDKTDEVFGKPRAIAFDHEVMRVFQNIGIAEQIQRHMGPYVPTDYIGSDGRPIAHFVSRPGPAKLGWQPNYVFNQPAVERAIRAQATALPGLTFCLQHEVLESHQSDVSDFVRLTVRTKDNGNATIEARYVIACDGANSVIRRFLDIPLTNLHFDKPFLVVDADVLEPALSRLPAVNVQDCNPARPSTYIVGPGAHRRWEIMLLEGEALELINNPKRIASLLAKWMSPSEANVVRAATYYFHAMYAETLRKGRIFLAGDAAHQTPPFMGQGMAQGIRDVANLTWKLKRVLKGSAGDILLDTYQKERLRHVIKTTQQAVGLGKVICELDPQAAADRDKLMRKTNGDPPRTQFRQDLIPPLESGFALPPLAGVSGELAPQPKITLRDGSSALLDDVSGSDFRIIADSEFAATINRAQLAAIRQFGIELFAVAPPQAPPTAGADTVVIENDGYMLDWLITAGCRAILVRPDHYIYAGLNDWAHLDSVLLQLAGTMGLSPAATATTPLN